VALAAYERILVNDPDNESAKRGLVRVKRIIQPPATQFFAEAGATGDNNPTQVPTGANHDVLGYGQLRVKDERNLCDTRWRTVIGPYGEAYHENTALDYANLNATAGPIYDLGASMVSVHPAIGGGVSYYDGHYFYGDVNVSATFEGYLNGACEWTKLRAGYRDFDPFFTSDSGFYADFTGKFSKSDVIAPDDLISVAPWLRWSGISGTEVNNIFKEFSPGRYVQGGVKVEYDKVVADWLTVGASIAVSDRYFSVDLDPASGDNRQDLLVSPGATLLFADLFGAQSDLRVDYRYDHNDSNDDTHAFDNHSVTVAVVNRR
jgi:hypothetical protein